MDEMYGDVKAPGNNIWGHIVRVCNVRGVTVSYSGRGECADPVNEDAILERVGGRPPGRNIGSVS